MKKSLYGCSILLALVVLLTACPTYSSVTKENFDKIQDDMSYSQVIEILGQPTSTDSVSLGSVSGTSATWEGKKASISIQFFNDKVKIKTFNTEDHEIHLNDETGN